MNKATIKSSMIKVVDLPICWLQCSFVQDWGTPAYSQHKASPAKQVLPT